MAVKHIYTSSSSGMACLCFGQINQCGFTVSRKQHTSCIRQDERCCESSARLLNLNPKIYIIKKWNGSCQWAILRMNAKFLKRVNHPILKGSCTSPWEWKEYKVWGFFFCVERGVFINDINNIGKAVCTWKAQIRILQWPEPTDKQKSCIWHGA